jgi:hypothetical protein
VADVTFVVGLPAFFGISPSPGGGLASWRTDWLFITRETQAALEADFFQREVAGRLRTLTALRGSAEWPT